VFNDGSDVNSTPFTVTENTALAAAASPTITGKNFNGAYSTVIVENVLDTFFTGQDSIANKDGITCTLVNPASGVTISAISPSNTWQVSAPTNSYTGSTINIQVACQLIAPIVTA